MRRNSSRVATSTTSPAAANSKAGCSPTGCGSTGHRGERPRRRRDATCTGCSRRQVVLRSAPSTNRVAKAISVAGVTQVTVADAVGLPQPYASDVVRQGVPGHHRRERAEVRRLLRLLHLGSVPAIPLIKNPEMTRTDLRSKLLGDTILGTDTAFDLILEIAAIPGVKWSHAPCIGLRGSIGGAVAPTAERIRDADPETEEPFESPMDGRSLRWKEEEKAFPFADGFLRGLCILLCAFDAGGPGELHQRGDRRAGTLLRQRRPTGLRPDQPPGSGQGGALRAVFAVGQVDPPPLPRRVLRRGRNGSRRRRHARRTGRRACRALVSSGVRSVR